MLKLKSVAVSLCCHNLPCFHVFSLSCLQYCFFTGFCSSVHENHKNNTNHEFDVHLRTRYIGLIFEL